ncbi:MAG TPA: hypothetical protein VK034_14500 [Enhygromyxa sp.]|nr:hypothetical protein [Enhygromyxa sp.]
MAGKFETAVATIDRAVRDMVALSGDVKTVAVRLESFESEMRSRLASTEERGEHRMIALEARVDRALGEFDRRLRDIEQQLARIVGFMGQIEGKAAAYLVERALEIQQARGFPVDNQGGLGGEA